MRVLIFHGYLLRGTGSNVYNANVAQALARLGHDVHLLCQDRQAAELGWISAVGRWDDGELRVEPAGGDAPGPDEPGRITAYLPDIHGVLPVYVRDRYEGFEVKEFPELGEAELDRYLEANVAAVRDVAARAGGIDAALANHLVMGPAILARAALGEHGLGPGGFAAKIHGSALEFTVKPSPRRFLPYAEEGMAAATGVLVGSRHTAESLWSAVETPGLAGKTRLGPPGVDVEEFAPAPARAATERVRTLAGQIAGDTGGSVFGRDGPAAAASLATFAEAPGPRVIFVGKLIRTKGVDLVLAAWPLVTGRHPGARLLVVGFGEARPGLERLWAALSAGELDAARRIAAGDEAGGGGLRYLGAFLSAPPPGYDRAAAAAAGSVLFAGRLEHEEVARIMPAADAMVVPSTFPEAFGMVAAEAAAAGVLPVSTAHSGLLEVSRALAETLPAEARDLVSFPLGEGSVEAIAERLRGWLELPEAAREQAGAALARTAREHWSWAGVAQGVLAAAAGRLDELAPVPAGGSPPAGSAATDG